MKEKKTLYRFNPDATGTTGVRAHRYYGHDVLPDHEYIGIVEDDTDKFIYHMSIQEITGGHKMNSDLIYEITDEQEVIQDIAQMNNMLVVSTNMRVTYHFYKQGVQDNGLSGQYLINESLQDLPDITHTTYQGATKYENLTNGSEVTTFGAAVSDYYEKKAAAAKENYIEGNVFLILAYRLTDGTYIKHTNPFYCYTPYMYGPGLSTTGGGLHIEYNTGDQEYRVMKMQFAKVAVKVEVTIPDEWKEVISSVDIFATRPESRFDMGQDINDYKIWLATEPVVHEPKIRDMAPLFHTALFYKVDTIPLASLEESAYTNASLDFKQIETKEVLPPDQLSHHEHTFKISLLYNSRLHIGDIDIQLYKGHRLLVDESTQGMLDYIYDEADSVEAITSDEGDIHILTTIKTPQEEREVEYVIEDDRHIAAVFQDPITHNQHVFWPVLSYPHPGANNIKIYSIDMETNKRVYISQPLKTHEYYSFAYYLHIEDGIPRFVDWYSFKNELGLPELNNSYSDPNRMQVSAINNPIYLPAINSYQVGDDDGNALKALAVQSAPTSEGQFGQYPLVVFGTGGIHIVDQGVGGVLYSSIRQVSRLKANTGTLSIDGAVIFSTNEGLHIIQGRNVKELSRKLVSNLVYNINDQDDLGVPHPRRDILVYGDDMTSYLRGAAYGWDNLHQEVIINNSSADYDYHLCYNPSQDNYFLATGNWKSLFLKDGRYYGFKDSDETDQQIDTMDEDTIYGVDSHVKVYLCSNPQSLGSTHYKRLLQCKIDCDLLIPDDGDEIAGFFLYGSNLTPGEDSEMTKEVFEKLQQRYIGANRHVVSMITGRTPMSVRYLMFVFRGDLHPDSIIRGITAVMEERMAKRLR